LARIVSDGHDQTRARKGQGGGRRSGGGQAAVGRRGESGIGEGVEETWRENQAWMAPEAGRAWGAGSCLRCADDKLPQSAPSRDGGKRAMARKRAAFEPSDTAYTDRGLERARESERRGVGWGGEGQRAEAWKQHEVTFAKERLRRKDGARPLVVSFVEEGEVDRQQPTPLCHVLDQLMFVWFYHEYDRPDA